MTKSERGSLERTYLIDGYNLIRRAFDFSAAGARDLASERAMLEVLLREFQRARPGARLILIYDGSLEVDGVGSGSQVAGLDVRFTLPPESADDRILTEARRRRGREQVTVVTSDRKDIVRPLEGTGVGLTSSEDFADLLEETLSRRQRFLQGAASQEKTTQKPRPKEKPESLSSEEVGEWLSVFSEPLPVADEPARPAAEETTEEPESPDSGEKPSKISSEEVAEWLRVFSRSRRED